jgi:hypothetical protein
MYNWEILRDSDMASWEIPEVFLEVSLGKSSNQIDYRTATGLY